MRTSLQKHCPLVLVSGLILLASAGCGGRIETIKVRPLEYPTETVGKADPTAHSVEPDNPRLARAIALYETGQFVAARDTLDQMLWEAPRGWRVYYHLGRVHTECRQYQLAESRLGQSLDLAPEEKLTRSRIYLALAENSEIQGVTVHARQYYLAALNLDPESVAASEALKRLEALTGLTD